MRRRPFGEVVHLCDTAWQAPGSVAEALHAASASLDYRIPVAGELPAAACGQALTALGEIRARFTAAHAAVLRRFDALDGHDGDGYGTSAWLAAMSRMSAKDAKASVRQMRALGRHRPLEEALRKLPAQLRDDSEAILGIEKILTQAAASLS